MFIVIGVIVIAVVLFAILKALTNRGPSSMGYSNGRNYLQPGNSDFVQPMYSEPPFVEPNTIAEIATIAAAEIAVDLVEDAIFGGGNDFDSGFDDNGFDGGGDFF